MQNVRSAIEEIEEAINLEVAKQLDPDGWEDEQAARAKAAASGDKDYQEVGNFAGI